MADLMYVVRDEDGVYVGNEDGTKRTPDPAGAHEFDHRADAEAACSRATDKVLVRDVA